jgi:hypothetical protein
MLIEPKHTQGTWWLSNNIQYGWKTNPYSITTRKPGVHLTTVANIPAKATISLEEAFANAKLIAAAPDLLDALLTMPQGLHISDDELWAWQEKASNAIDKAINGLI